MEGMLFYFLFCQLKAGCTFLDTQSLCLLWWLSAPPPQVYVRSNGMPLTAQCEIWVYLKANTRFRIQLRLEFGYLKKRERGECVQYFIL